MITKETNFTRGYENFWSRSRKKKGKNWKENEKLKKKITKNKKFRKIEKTKRNKWKYKQKTFGQILGSGSSWEHFSNPLESFHWICNWKGILISESTSKGK